MILTVKYFFLADFIAEGVILDLDKHIFPWKKCLFVGHLRLGLSFYRSIRYYRYGS